MAVSVNIGGLWNLEAKGGSFVGSYDGYGYRVTGYGFARDLVLIFGHEVSRFG